LGKRAIRLSDSPAFQWYAAEYLADENVTLMTLEEEGAYIRAISYCWREGSIPSDPTLLSRLLKNASSEVVQTVVQRFRKIETENGTRLVHGRLEKERRKQAEWRKKSADGGKLSGKHRREKRLHAEANAKGGSVLVEPNGNRPLEPNANSSSSSSSSSSLSKKQKQKPIARSVPPDELAGTLPLVDGSDFQISKDQVSEWTEAFPGIDVKAQLKQAKAWLGANPTRKKTRRGILRFVVAWLDRAQNKSGGGNGKQSQNQGGTQSGDDLSSGKTGSAYFDNLLESAGAAG